MNYNKIEYLLNEKKLTQKDLIHYLKMSRQGFYTMIEKKSMKVSTLELMSDFFNVPITYWFEEENNFISEPQIIYQSTIPLKKTMVQLEKDLEYFREKVIKLEQNLEDLSE